MHRLLRPGAALASLTVAFLLLGPSAGESQNGIPQQLEALMTAIHSVRVDESLLQDEVREVHTTTSRIEDQTAGIQRDTADIDGLLAEMHKSTNSVEQMISGVLVADERLRFTPPAHVGDGRCLWSVVGGHSRTVRAEVIRLSAPQQSTTPAAVVASHTATLPPGGAAWAHIQEALGDAICRFTVLDGTKADIRASVVMFDPVLNREVLIAAAD